ncbi:TnsA endonuclease N-terminal domain-containing protein [Chromobacterium violaceum]
MTSRNYEVLVAAVCKLLNSTHPVRDAFHKHGNGSYRGMSPSNKGIDGCIPYESGLARDAIRLYNLAPEVMLIIPEPFVLDYELDGEARSYTPDFLLQLRDGRRAVVEIKYQAEANTPENQRRFQAIASLIESAGGLFAVVTEKTLRDKVLLHNLGLVEGQRHRHIPLTAKTAMLQILSEGPASLEALSSAAGDVRLVYAAIGQEWLAVSLYQPLRPSTLIWRI